VYATVPAGVFRSDNGGQTWTQASNGLEGASIVALALHPKQPDTLFAATAGGALFRSTDGAGRWAAMGH